MFAGSAALMALLAALPSRALPRWEPRSSVSYADNLRSLGPLLRDVPTLRRRAAYHAAVFAGYSLFWTAVPLLLTSPRFG